jgi:LPS-assembly lipoprotein
MSSSEASKSASRNRGHASSVSRRAALRTIGLGILGAGMAGGLTGCGDSGFRPLYGSLGGAGVEEKLTHVDFTPIPGRNGQRIRNELIFKAYGGGVGAAAKFRLDIAIKESAATTLVLRDGTSAGQIFQIDARFQLVDMATKKVILEGLSQSRATYERFANTFSNVRAGDEAQDRAAKTIATDINARIAAFLSTVKV